jgi:hypothetical protein
MSQQDRALNPEGHYPFDGYGFLSSTSGSSYYGVTSNPMTNAVMADITNILGVCDGSSIKVYPENESFIPSPLQRRVMAMCVSVLRIKGAHYLKATCFDKTKNLLVKYTRNGRDKTFLVHAKRNGNAKSLVCNMQPGALLGLDYETVDFHEYVEAYVKSI